MTITSNKYNLYNITYITSIYSLSIFYLSPGSEGELAHTTLPFVFTLPMSALAHHALNEAKGEGALFFFNINFFSNCIIKLGVALTVLSVLLLFLLLRNGSNSTHVSPTCSLKSKFLKYYLAATGVSTNNLNPGLFSVPGDKGSIDPSSFYSLPFYKSCEDLMRMQANANYFKGSWNSILRYKLDKVWEKQEIEAYYANSTNFPNSSCLEPGYPYIFIIIVIFIFLIFLLMLTIFFISLRCASCARERKIKE